MSRETQSRRSGLLYGAMVLVLLVGGVALWKLGTKGGRGGPVASERERERHRVAALDPGFDPGKPGGTLEGIVNDAEGKPVDGAAVAVTRQRSRDDLPSFSRPIPRTALTANGGRFTLADVLPGEYGVTATALVGSPARQNKVAITSGQTTQVTLTLGTGGALLTGEVQDAGGGPIGGAKALLRTIKFGGRPGDEPSWFQIAADDKGVFKVRLAAGDYDLTVTAEGYAPARDRLPMSTDQTRRWRLNPAARLSGRVLDRHSKDPVAGATVWLRTDRVEGYMDREATSDGEGRFGFDDLAAGGYIVLARADRRVGLTPAVSVGIAEAANDVDVLVDPGRAIRGKVVGGDGKGLADIRVVAFRSEPPFDRPLFVKSRADGAFALEGLLPAKYRVTGFAQDKGVNSKEATAQVTSRDVEGLQLTLNEAAVVRGQVVDAKGAPVAEAEVSGVVETTAADRRFALDRATTDAAGKFELLRLSPGKLTITAKHRQHGNGKWGPDETATAQATAVTVRLEPAGSISGLVKFEDGSPAARAIVMAPPQSNPGQPMFGPPEQTTTDQTGHFTLTGLEKGRYMVFARRTEGSAFTPQGRQDITLGPGEQKAGVELVIAAGGKRIAGKVVRPDGQAVSGAVVSAGLEREGVAFRMPNREGGPGGAQNAISDVDGNFAIEDLQDGTYTLWAADSAHADGEQKGVAAGATGITIRLAAGASVAGVVRTRQGAAVSDYNIAALPGGHQGSSRDDRMRTQMTARMWSPSAQVHDPAGAFFIGRLSPGAYELTVTTADGQSGQLALNLAAGEKKEGLSVEIDAGGNLAGRVVDLDSGAPLEGVRVFASSATTRLNGITGKDGGFTLTGASVGHWRIDFQPGGGESHVPEYKEIDLKTGAGDVDLGLIRMMKGNVNERGGSFADRGRIGFTPGLVEGKPAVTGVRPGFPAALAGLREGDLLLSMNGRSVEGLGGGALDFLGSGKLSEPLIVKIQPRDGGPAREIRIDRVPMDYDPAHPQKAGAPPAAAAPVAPARTGP
jgi:hypothetical protein